MKQRLQQYFKGEGSKRFWGDLFFDVVGTMTFSVGIQCFSAPSNIAPGGATGLSILVNYLTGLPISMVTLLINVPLLLAAWVFLGKRFTLRTIKTVAIMTLSLEFCAQFLPVYQGEPMLAALYGGVLDGIGLALVLMRSSTTGGTDVASRLIQIKFPNVQMGRIMLFVDACVLIASALVYRHIENALYGLIAIFTATRIIDSVLYGLDVGKVMMIVTDFYQEVADQINHQLGRGCTLLDAKGSYTMQKRTVVMCAVRKSQYYELKRLVHHVDPTAFMVALEANEIIGEGFKSPEQLKK